jgi:hypothetical protein
LTVFLTYLGSSRKWLLVLNLSNRFLALEPLVAAHADALGLVGVAKARTRLTAVFMPNPMPAPCAGPA